MRLQRAMYLKRLKEVTREHRPSLNGKRVGRGKKGQIFFFLQTQMRRLVGFQKDFPHLLCVFQAFNLSLYLISRGTQLMFSVLEVKGEATEASASERETPTSAALSAPQSLAPSPHIPTRQLQKQQQYFTVNVIKMTLSVYFYSVLFPICSPYVSTPFQFVYAAETALTSVFAAPSLAGFSGQGPCVQISWLSSKPAVTAG